MFTCRDYFRETINPRELAPETCEAMLLHELSCDACLKLAADYVSALGELGLLPKVPDAVTERIFAAVLSMVDQTPDLPDELGIPDQL